MSGKLKKMIFAFVLLAIATTSFVYFFAKEKQDVHSKIEMQAIELMVSDLRAKGKVLPSSVIIKAEVDSGTCTVTARSKSDVPKGVRTGDYIYQYIIDINSWEIIERRVSG